MTIFVRHICLLSLLLSSFALQADFAEKESCPDRAASKTRLHNLTISDTHQFVWFRVAKVGTRTIFNILANNEVPFSVNAYQVPYSAKEYKNYFKFAFVRNPWDRVVSCYCNKVLTQGHKRFRECFGKGFDYFVDYIRKQNLHTADAHIRLQTALIPLDEVDFIGRLENFNEDLLYVMGMLGLQHVAIPHKNKSTHTHYSTYYNRKTRQIIAEKYRADIEAFGYQFESID